ncbi:protein toll-like [Phymastichus coffea]|uniref:protein toll-like n=1 Tax=Phymastichus coffea TaxID=108790 RepID=UPI00273CBEA4|nr:protein toll-like [Phymastichus coffea]XP_058803617.1 protein toll-like [Phymastichus coffea]XP_058803618.1 protein toll-like [Phymastichus coffea]
MARSGRAPLLGLLAALAATATLASLRDCHLGAELGDERFGVSCGVRDKQVEVAVRCNRSGRGDATWSRFPERRLDLWSVGTLRFGNCELPEELRLREVVRALNVSLVDTLSLEDLRSGVSRQNLRGLSVRVLVIARAGFSRLPADALHDLAGLKSLRIEQTALTGIPEGFFAEWSSGLRNISLLSNRLSRIGRRDLAGAEEAQRVWLSHNRIEEIELGAFDRLPNLLRIDLSGNRLRGLPAGLFHRLARLEGIHASANRFDELPAELLTGIDNCHLRSFRLSHNAGALATMPAGFFRDLGTLASVELLQNRFASLPEDLFAGATALELLDLSGNNLTSLPPAIFGDTRKLVQLRIMDNQLAYLPRGIFRKLNNLEQLYLNNNCLANITSDILEGIDGVKILQAAWNNISYIDSNFCQYLKVVEELNLMGNRITLEQQPPDAVSVVVSCTFLRKLIVPYNKISRFFLDWAWVGRLEVIDLRYNEITEFGDSVLFHLPGEVTVYLQNNKISSIDLRRLEIDADQYFNTNNIDKGMKVYLGSNPLDCDCHLVDLLRYFENKMNPRVKSYVEIYADVVGIGNKINVGLEAFECAGPEEFANRKLTDIRSADLNCPVVSDEPDDACSNSCFCREYPERRILSVDCSHRNLTKLPISIANANGWSIELDMSHNKFSQTPSLNSSYLSNVTSLDLSSNNISIVTLDVFSRKLQQLKLHNNSISRLDQKLIDYLSEDQALHNLTLHGNKWECVCQSRNFVGLAKAKLAPRELNRIACYGTDRRLSTVTAEELCEGAIAIIVGASLFVAFAGIVIGSLAAFYYRYQKEIKVWLYSKHWCLCLVTEDELDKDKKYDAFISFSHKDEDFVEREIIAKLEEGPRPYKLCLHYRDWLAGEWIPLQISRSVEESRRTVVILSPNFLESVWGRMEFRAAHTQVLKEGRARLIVILYGEIGNTDSLDPELKSYLNHNTYVKWGDPWFWDKLRYALPHRYERKTRNARIIENHLAQPPITNGNADSPTGKAEVIPMPKLATFTNDSAKLLDSGAEDDKIVASCQ